MIETKSNFVQALFWIYTEFQVFKATFETWYLTKSVIKYRPSVYSIRSDGIKALVLKLLLIKSGLNRFPSRPQNPRSYHDRLTIVPRSCPKIKI